MDFGRCREYAQAGTDWTLEQWLAVCRGRKASDRRDLVFGGGAFLGDHAAITVPDLWPELRVLISGDLDALGADYSKTPKAVYVEFTLTLLRGLLGINALSLVGVLPADDDNDVFPLRVVEEDDVLQLPSWVVPMHYQLLPMPLYQIPRT